MKQFRLKFTVAISLLLISIFSFASGSQDPVNLLQSIADQMITELKAHQATLKTNPSYVYTLADRLVVPHADLDEMSKRVLPPQTWASATPQQKVQFEKEFKTILERTYGSALAEYTDQTVNFFPVRESLEDKSSVVVNSKIIRTDGPSISVSYRVIRKGDHWKLYDMTIEGVSMLESFRSQFADKLSQGNMTDLIHTLAEHNQS